ncbi:MAG: acyl carrier protein [Lachnospiraceae bacterium]|nr:acyl carrier protein [Lachnospiraceae bacterium]MCR5082283.1 acyl carrier protein [Parasporobacterium sp.]
MFEQVKELIVDILCCDANDVTLEANLFDDLGADSLAAVELNISMDEKFGFSIPDEELEKVKTVKDIVDFVESHK